MTTTVTTAPSLTIKVLGPLTVERGGSVVDLGAPKQRAVFALLLTARGEVVGRDRILQGVWGDEASESKRASLYTYVSNLRTLLGDVITRVGTGYRMETDPHRLDSVAFEHTVDECRPLVATDPVTAGDNLRRALQMWRGHPYVDLEDIPGLVTERNRLEELRLTAVELRIDADIAAGRHESVITEVEALAEEYPLRERFRAQHMLSLYRSGRQTEALRAYERTRTYLADEVGLEPSQELQNLELAILEQDDKLRSGDARVTTQRLAFLVTDIEKSTSKWDQHPQAMADALATHDRILTETIEASGGRLFKHTGDGVLAAFSQVTAAVEAAEAAQRAFARATWGEVGELRVRMGVDIGEAEARSGDFYGPPLNRAARLAAAAHGGQVLVSSAAQVGITTAAPAGLQIRQLGEHQLRGFTAAERVGQLVFVGLPAEFPRLRVDADTGLDDRMSVLTLPGYEVRDKIEEGAFGVVYRAYQPSVGREVAIKVIRPELASHPGFIHRFEAEARTVARLAHPRIVPLIDFWRDPDGAYLVLHLLQGGSLRHVLATGAVDQGSARQMLHHVAEALDHAHSQGIPHGDLKPANILLDEGGNAYLSDFGIAARCLEPDLIASVSAAPEFRAPEESITGPTREADLFALGVIARQLLDDPAAEPVLARATATSPSDRYTSAAEFLTDLDRALGDVESDVDRPVVSRNPYKGLRAFEEGDAADFFGRRELVETLLAALERHRFVTVVGPSGSGKSSVVQAGLLPSLTDGSLPGSHLWPRVLLSPGSHPTDSLIEAVERVAPGPIAIGEILLDAGLNEVVRAILDGTEGELVVVVDQLEELFTLVDDVERRQEFVALLVEAVEAEDSQVRVVTTLRADFYDRPLENSRLGRLVSDGLVTVLSPSAEELIELIAAPAHAVGLRWEPGLPHRIAQDVVDQPGGLPLLQYALTELVERRRGDLLTGEDYERIGGVAGALAMRAESVFAELSPGQQEAARQILLRLVSVEEDTDHTRRRIRRRELESLGIDRPDLEAVLEIFTQERLLLTDRDPLTRGPTVEVAHEALLREWPRLRTWIEDQREALILGRRFRAAMSEWEATGHDPGYLLTGSRLVPFVSWAETSSLSSDEREFFEASKAADTAARESRRRRRRTLTAALASAALVGLLLAGWAFVERGRATEEAIRAEAEADQRQIAQEEAEAQRAEALAQSERAEQQADLAERSAAVARSRELAASAINVLGEDPTLSKLLALAAADIAEPPLESVSALHRAYAADKVVARYSWPEDVPTAWELWTAPDPAGERLVAAGADGLPLSTFHGHLEVVDIATGEVIWDWDTTHPQVSIERSRFTDDGGLVVTTSLWETPTREGPAPGPAELGLFTRDAETGAPVDRFDLGTCGGSFQALVGRKALVMSIPEDHEACFWEAPGTWILELIDIDSGERRLLTDRARQGAGTSDGGGALSADGRYVAFDDSGLNRVLVMDLATGEQIAELELGDTTNPNAYVRRLSADGSRLIYGKAPIRVVDVSSGETTAEIDTLDSWIEMDDETLYVTDSEGDLSGYDLSTGELRFTIARTGTGNIALMQGGRLLVSDGSGAASIVATRPRGELGAVETCDGLVYPSLNVGTEHATFKQACMADQVDPAYIRTTAAVFTSYLVDLETMEIEYSLPDVKGRHQPISPDGTRMVHQVGDGAFLTGPLVVRDLETGETILELEGTCWWDVEAAGEESECVGRTAPPFALMATRVRWSPDGSMIAAINGTLRGVGAYLAVWDAETGELLFFEPGNTDLSHHIDAIFTPDSSGLVTSYWGATMRRFSTETWEVETEVGTGEQAGARGVYFLDYDADESHLLLVDLNEFQSFAHSAASLYWLDANTLEQSSMRSNIHSSEVLAAASNASRSQIATASSNSEIRVWDTASGELLHEIALGVGPIRGVAFINDFHLAITPQDGNLLIVTIDTDELLDLVRRSLSRGFSEVECEKFNFGEDCPTLEQLRTEH